MSDDVQALRAALFSTIADLRAGTIDTEHARGVNELAKTIVESARVEVDFVRAAGLDGAMSAFLGEAIALPAPAGPTGVRGTVTHRIGR